jgi:hypothetical protein
MKKFYAYVIVSAVLNLVGLMLAFYPQKGTGAPLFYVGAGAMVLIGFSFLGMAYQEKKLGKIHHLNVQ